MEVRAKTCLPFPEVPLFSIIAHGPKLEIGRKGKACLWGTEEEDVGLCLRPQDSGPQSMLHFLLRFFLLCSWTSLFLPQQVLYLWFTWYITQSSVQPLNNMRENQGKLQDPDLPLAYFKKCIFVMNQLWFSYTSSKVWDRALDYR